MQIRVQQPAALCQQCSLHRIHGQNPARSLYCNILQLVSRHRASHAASASSASLRQVASRSVPGCRDAARALRTPAETLCAVLRAGTRRWCCRGCWSRSSAAGTTSHSSISCRRSYRSACRVWGTVLSVSHPLKRPAVLRTNQGVPGACKACGSTAVVPAAVKYMVQLCIYISICSWLSGAAGVSRRVSSRHPGYAARRCPSAAGVLAKCYHRSPFCPHRLLSSELAHSNAAIKEQTLEVGLASCGSTGLPGWSIARQLQLSQHMVSRR